MLTKLVLLDLLLFKIVQWMRAASIRPHIRKGDLFGCAFLKQQFTIGGSEDER